MKKKPIRFRPIPGAERGHMALTIQPPGTWFDDPNYVVFVGGCGVGHARTLTTAKTLLLDKARAACLHRVVEAERVAAHYRSMLWALDREGLQKEEA